MFLALVLVHITVHRLKAFATFRLMEKVACWHMRIFRKAVLPILMMQRPTQIKTDEYVLLSANK